MHTYFVYFGLRSNKRQFNTFLVYLYLDGANKIETVLSRGGNTFLKCRKIIIHAGNKASLRFDWKSKYFTNLFHSRRWELSKIRRKICFNFRRGVCYFSAFMRSLQAIRVFATAVISSDYIVCKCRFFLNKLSHLSQLLSFHVCTYLGVFKCSPNIL